MLLAEIMAACSHQVVCGCMGVLVVGRGKEKFGPIRQSICLLQYTGPSLRVNIDLISGLARMLVHFLLSLCVCIHCVTLCVCVCVCIHCVTLCVCVYIVLSVWFK